MTAVDKQSSMHSDPWQPTAAQSDTGRSVTAQPTIKPPRKIRWNLLAAAVVALAGCAGHRFMVLDWEIYELYRCQAMGPEAAVEDVLHRYNVVLSPLTHDVHFFIGTSIQHQAQFSMIGVYYPPRQRASN